MIKKLQQKLAYFLSAVLILGSCIPTTASAATIKANDGGGSKVTYALSELTKAAVWNATVTEEEGYTDISFPGQFNQVFYTVPDEVKAAGVKSFELTFTDDSNANNLCLKVNKEVSGEKSATIVVDYWKSGLTIPEETADRDVAYIVFMSTLKDEASDYKVKSITFNTRDTLETSEEDSEDDQKPAGYGDPVVTKTEKKIEISGGISFEGRWDSSAVSKNELSFAEQYAEVVYKFSEEIELATVDSIVVDVKDQTGTLTFKTYKDPMTEDNPAYGMNGSSSYTFKPKATEGNLVAIGVMNSEKKAIGVTVTKITINLKEAPAENTGDDKEPEEKPEKEPVDYGDPVVTVGNNKIDISGGITVYNRWNSGQTFKNEISFGAQYTEYVLDLPQAIDLEKCLGITVEVDDQEDEIAVKMLDSSLAQLQVNYGLSGSKTYSISATGEGMSSAISFMSTKKEGYPYGITLKKVTIEMEEGALTPSKDTTVTLSEITLIHKEDGKAIEGNTISFSNLWDEYVVAFPETIDLDALDSVTVKVSDQKGTISFKFLAYEDDAYSELQAFYGKSGAKSYGLASTASGKMKYLGIMAHDEDVEYPFNVTIEGVSYKLLDTSGEPVDKEVETDLYNLRDKVAKTAGSDFLIGTAISYQEFADSKEMTLVTKHFNAVTLGNELKADSLIKESAERVTVDFNGQSLLVPVLDFSNPDRYLDYFVDWNEKNPEQKIQIRGHVLVWHSQLPEFFLHEDYDKTKAYVSTEVMNQRLEWYIKSVAEHYTSENSKYNGLFYGWDVVNEAVSDSTGIYRNASENSSWWALYQSPEFIKNAFVYANKYFPADVKLFYNDYNETGDQKMKGIVALLKEVKNTDGARIDGMGMQGHYSIDASNPSVAQFTKAARAYAEVVGEVQVTELDFKGASSATDERLANRYAEIYNAIRRLRSEGVNFSAMTIWGVVDKHSWLQTANSAGGGSTTNSKQYPLLFNNNYKAKNSFYAIAEAGELEPEIKEVSIIQTQDGSFAAGNTYTLPGKKATFIPVWNEDGVKVRVNVSDTTSNAKDAVTVYVSIDGEIYSKTVNRIYGNETETGYEVIASIPAKDFADKKIGLDVAVTDNDALYAFNDTTMKQGSSSKYYAKATLFKSMNANKGTIAVDGEGDDAAWAKAVSTPLTINIGSSVTADAKVLWDAEKLYVLVNVKDAVLNKASSDAYQQDSLEVFIDENNHKSDSYEDDDKQYRVNYDNEQSFNGTKCKAENIESAAKITDDGYVIEAAFKWTDLTPASGTVIGLELQINDADASGSRKGTLSWNDTTGMGWSSTSVYGAVILREEKASEAVVPVTVPAEKEKDNFAAATLATPVKDLLDSILTEVDKADLAEGKKIDVWVNVADVTESVSTEEKGKVEEKLPEKYSVGTYLDINLFKQTEGKSATKVKTTPNGKVEIQITLPVTLRGEGRTYKIIRIHDGVATVLDAVIDPTDFTLSFETDSFSTYAVVYAEKEPEKTPTKEPEKTPEVKTETPVQTTVTAAPKTVTKVVDVEYTVVRGDSLSKIARKYNMTLKDLLALNPFIKNPNKIRVGQKIVIGKQTVTVTEAEAKKIDDGKSSLAMHVVQPSEYLNKIAKKYNMSLNRLLALNPQIKNPNRIRVGQKLNVELKK